MTPTTRVYRLEKFLRSGEVEKKSERRLPGYAEAFAAMQQILGSLHTVRGETCRITCVASGECVQWRYGDAPGDHRVEWRRERDTFKHAEVAP